MAMTGSVDRAKEGHNFRAMVVTVAILLGCFLLAMFIRCYWYYGPAVAPADTYGQYHYVVSGNDPDYHKRSIDYALETGHALTWDPLMNYPNGAPNPNPPAFAWSSIFLGMLVSPFYNFDITQAVWMFFEASPAFWAALTVFPVYFFTRDMFGRKPAFFAAFFIAVMAGNVERTPLGFSDHDSFIMFFVTSGFFFLMRALKNLDERNWVKRWRDPPYVAQGVIDFFRQQRVAVLYSALAGISIAAVMLSWKGTSYVYAILFMYFGVHAWVKRFRKEDPFGIAMVILITLGLPLLITFPYYYNMKFIMWFDDPFFIFLATTLLAAVTVVTRNQPWMMVLVSLLVMGGGAYIVLAKYFPDVFDLILGFQGYFIRDKLYTTIAEAQPPDFSRLVYSYGEYVFYFGLIALIVAAWRLPRERWRNDYIFTIMWCIMAIYMAMSAVRFMYNATPVFAILGGWVTWTIVKLLDFKKMAKTYKGLNEGRWIPRWRAVKSSVKVRHVVGAFFIGYMVMGSATFYGLDAGIPYETKKQFDKDLYYFLPSALRPANYDPEGSSLWWFGSFGTAFPSDYWTDGMFWLRTQDNNESPEDRPAFVAWWDYGHWCTHMAIHPSIADNFQQGVEISGNIITAQNESSVIALFIARTAEGSTQDSGVRAVLVRYLGEEAAQEFIDIEEQKDLPHWRAEILKHPDIYGVRAGDINDLNTKWVALRGLLASRLPGRQLADLYREVCEASGHEIRYFAADSRMFPFEARNTGIYYAPVKLSDQDINDFLKVLAVGNDGQRYDPANIPESLRRDQEFRIVDYELVYEAPFYNSLFYRAYIGYSPMDVGLSSSDGIPSMVGNMRTGQYPPMQGWNMSNFRLEYRTAYWNPYNESTGLANHSADWKVVPPWTARTYQADSTGIVDTFYRNLYQGVFMLKYYHGAFVNGTVRTDDGRPVPGARVTVYDDLPLAISYYPGVPHGYTFTDDQGRFSILAPYGNVTLKVTNGGVAGPDDQILLKETRELASDRFHVSDDQAMRRAVDLDRDGILDYNIRRALTVNSSGLQGRTYFDLDSDGSFTAGTDQPITGELRARNDTLGPVRSAQLDTDGKYQLHNLTPGNYLISVVHDGVEVDGGTAPVDPGTNATKDVPLQNIYISGNLTYENGTPAIGIQVGVQGSGGTALWSNASLANGSYLVEYILPGDYNVSITSPGYLQERIPVVVNQSSNISLDLTAIPLYPVTGHINLSVEGSSAPGTLVSFQSQDNFTRWVTATADSSGNYKAWVSRGNYSVYARMLRQTDLWVALTCLTLAQSPASLDLILEKGVRFNGTVFRDVNGNGVYDPTPISSTPTPDTGGGSGEPTISLPEYQAFSGVEVRGPSGWILLPANFHGYFESYFPPGEYTVRAGRNVSETEVHINITLVSLHDPVEMNLSLLPGVEVSGKLFWDKNGDEVADLDETVGSSRMIFTERKRPDRSLEALTAPNGTYRVFISQRTDYEVVFRVPGYENTSDSLTTGLEALTRNFKLEAAKVPIELGLTVRGKPAPAGIVVHFIVRSTGAQNVNLTTDASGRLTGALTPGLYELSVLQNASLDIGLANLSLVQPLMVEVGQSKLDLTLPLVYKVYLSGVAFYDENGDGVAQRVEYRNTLVKLIPENLSLDTDASAPGIPYQPAVLSQGTVEGRYEIALEPGNYTLWTLLPLPTPQGPDLVFIGRLEVGRSETLNLSLSAGCKVRGMTYIDFNRNGRYDSGESRNGVGVSLTEGGRVLMTVASDPGGWYELTLPQGRRYVLDVDNTTNETFSESEFVPIRYLASARLDLPLSTSLELNLSVLRQISAAGLVTYDRNANGSADAQEGVARIRVLFTNSTGATFPAPTNDTGSFAIYLEEGRYNLSVDAPGYNSSVKGRASVDLSLENRLFDFELAAVNATLALGVAPPGSPPGSRIPGGAAVTLRALDSRAVNISGRTDAFGNLRLSVAPGIYSLHVATGGGRANGLVYFGPLDVEPAGGTVPVTVNLTLAARVWGSAFYHDDAGDLVRPAWVNFTFNATLTVDGINYTSSVDFGDRPAVYELPLPAGNFSASATFLTSANGLNLTYNASGTLNISRNDTAVQWDVTLAKVKDHSIGLRWNETQKVTIPTNGTANYTVELSNAGNERFSIDLEIFKPATWSVNLSLDKATLEVGENLTVKVDIRAPENANAGDNMITLNASSSELPGRFFNVSRLMVYVVQKYGGELTDPLGAAVAEKSAVSYKFKLTNKGNGADTFNLTVSGPHGWNLTLSEYNPQLSAGESKELQLRAQPFEGARIDAGLTARLTATSKSALAPTAELTVNLTFPLLSGGELQASGPGVSYPKPGWLPGFEALGLVAAIGAAAFLARRRLAR